MNENMNNVLAFSSRFQPEGPPCYKVLKTVARSLVNETALQVTVIETEHFPYGEFFTHSLLVNSIYSTNHISLL